MKATKVIMPNGKERILIEVKPSEYEAVQKALTNAYIDDEGHATKKRKRMELFDCTMNDAPEQFEDFVLCKDNEAQ